ncbi:hypothetical protein EON63_07730 [archaeon]|nr:MAG: hypothetical protein EON63_07730 [archaeon]
MSLDYITVFGFDESFLTVLALILSAFVSIHICFGRNNRRSREYSVMLVLILMVSTQYYFLGNVATYIPSSRFFVYNVSSIYVCMCMYMFVYAKLYTQACHAHSKPYYTHTHTHTHAHTLNKHAPNCNPITPQSILHISSPNSPASLASDPARGARDPWTARSTMMSTPVTVLQALVCAGIR